MSTVTQILDEPVHLVEYDAAWPRTFLGESKRVAAALRLSSECLEHIGSTAVPGLLAKPVIDIMLGVEGWPPNAAIVEEVGRLGYEYLGEAGVPERLYFRLRGPADFNLHVVRTGGHHWRSNIALRDYLRSHHAARVRYAREKLAAISAGKTTLLAYSEAKSSLVAELLKSARTRDMIASSQTS